jgi:hypothetical protein
VHYNIVACGRVRMGAGGGFRYKRMTTPAGVVREETACRIR